MSSHQFSIAQPEQVYKRINELSKRSSEFQSRLAQPLKKLWDPLRNLACVNNLSVFSELYERFPNFIEVIQFYEVNAIALKRLNQPFEAYPVLLQGDPGLGKTYFVSELARVLGLSFYEISLATTTANFAISGGSTQWGDGSTGFVANSLVDSAIANPIMLIDEIDKASHLGNYNPMTPFYSLLEPHSAKRFKDEALEIELDTSKIIWIATSNYMHQIPEPIQSRMRTFKIDKPTVKHMPKIINSIYQNMRTHKVYGQMLTNNVNLELIDYLSNKTPREIKQSLEAGVMSAIKQNRDYLVVSDLPVYKDKEVHRVGFL